MSDSKETIDDIKLKVTCEQPVTSSTSTPEASANKLHTPTNLDPQELAQSISNPSDAAALKAIEQAMPTLPPLPPGSQDPVDIAFTFEWHDHK